MSRFFQPFAHRFCLRFDRYSDHFLPLFGGTCPGRKRPVAGLRVGRGGGMYSSINLAFFLSATAHGLDQRGGKSIKTAEQPPPLALQSVAMPLQYPFAVRPIVGSLLLQPFFAVAQVSLVVALPFSFTLRLIHRLKRQIILVFCALCACFTLGRLIARRCGLRRLWRRIWRT